MRANPSRKLPRGSYCVSAFVCISRAFRRLETFVGFSGSEAGAVLGGSRESTTTSSGILLTVADFPTASSASPTTAGRRFEHGLVVQGANGRTDVGTETGTGVVIGSLMIENIGVACCARCLNLPSIQSRGERCAGPGSCALRAGVLASVRKRRGGCGAVAPRKGSRIGGPRAPSCCSKSGSTTALLLLVACLP